jgi:hypothetical protein
MSFSIGVPYKKLSGKHTFVKFSSGDHTLLKGVNEFIAIYFYLFCYLFISWPFLVRFGVRNLHFMVLRKCEFRGNWLWDGLTLLMAIN